MILIKDHSDKFKVKKKKNVNFVSVFFSHMEKQWKFLFPTKDCL